MITLNNKEYKLLFLDTNAIREITNNHNSCGKVFFEKFFLNGPEYVPCFSIYNIIEIRTDKERFDIFLNFFSIIPCILFSSYKTIIKEEFLSLKNKSQVSLDKLILNTFYPSNDDKLYNFRKFITSNLEQKVIIQTIDNDIEGLDLIVKAWQSQKQETNKELKKRNLALNTINDKHYKLNEKESIINYLKNSEKIITTEIEKFPSIRIMQYSLFSRLYYTQKEIKKNDVMDIKISCIIPYIDAVITEKFQADVYKKAKKLIPQINDLEIYTLKDIKPTN